MVKTQSHRMMSLLRIALPLVLSGTFLGILGGCATKVDPQTQFMKKLGVEMSSRELRLRNYALSELFAARVELTADDILEVAEDPQIRQNVVLWKMHAIPSMQMAAFLGDPLGACIAEVVYIVKVRHYFEGPYGLETAGEFQPVAIAAARELEDDAFEHLALVLPSRDIDSLRVKANEFALESPIRSPRFTHGASDLVLSAVVADDEMVGGVKVASAMNEQMRDLSDRLAMLSDYGPRQARWQVQYLREQAPEISALVRDTALAAMSPMTEDFMAFADAQRELLTAYVTGEREAILAALRTERVEATNESFDQIAIAQAAAFDAVALERAAIMADVSAMMQASMTEMLAQSEVTTARLIDHSVRDIGLLLFVPFIVFSGIGIAAVVVAHRALRDRSGRPSKDV